MNETLIDPPDGFASSGQVIIFNLTITNTSNDTITKFPLQNTFDQAHLTFQSAIPSADILNPGQISWNDLTDSFGDLTPGTTINLAISFVLNQLPPSITNTVSRAVGVGGELSDGTLLPSCNASARVSIRPEQTPTSTPAPTSTPTPSPPPDRPSQTPLPPTPVAVNVPVATSTVFPVAFLPATGEKELHYEGWTLIAGLLLLVLGSLAIGCYLGKNNI